MVATISSIILLPSNGKISSRIVKMPKWNEFGPENLRRIMYWIREMSINLLKLYWAWYWKRHGKQTWEKFSVRSQLPEIHTCHHPISHWRQLVASSTRNRVSLEPRTFYPFIGNSIRLVNLRLFSSSGTQCLPRSGSDFVVVPNNKHVASYDHIGKCAGEWTVKIVLCVVMLIHLPETILIWLNKSVELNCPR